MTQRVTLAFGLPLGLLLVTQLAVADLWWSDIAPASPESENDEFNGASLHARWSTWDPGTFTTVTIDTTRETLKLAATGVGGAPGRWGGIYQPVPGSEFAVYAKLSAISSGTMAAGLFLSEDLDSAPATADFRTAEVVWSTDMRWEARTWPAYNSSTVSASTTRSALPLGAYVRVRVNGTSCSTDFSSDGVNWANFATVTLGFTPVHMGLALSQNAASQGILLVDFFRVFSGAGTSGIDATKIGGQPGGGHL
jgi:hypothetical protein